MRSAPSSVPSRRAAGGLAVAMPIAAAAGGLAVAMLIAAAASAWAAPQTKDQQRCTGAMNLALFRVAGAAGREVLGCLRSGPGDSPSLEACSTADAKEKVAKARAKTVSQFEKRCTGSSRRPPGAPKLPDFGATDAETVNAAGAGAAYDLFHDVFGIDLDAGVVPAEEGRDAALCQQRVAKAVHACHAAKLREFNSCKKLGLRDSDDPFESAEELASCFGVDSKGKVAKRCDRREEVRPGRLRVDGMRQQLAKKCVAKGVDLAGAFPRCGGTDPEATHGCLERAVDCRACLALSAADGLGLDCDLLDDGLDNESCAPSLGRHACELDPDSGFLFDSRAGFLGGTLAGRIELDCGGPGTDGSAPCRCRLDGVTPVEVPSVGWTCVSPVAGCPPGEAACAGDTSLDFTIAADHDVGACTGNGGCAAQCESHCAASGAEVWDSGCEGFCEGGAADGAACSGDTDCPAGRCNGVAGTGHGNVCQCQCISLAGEPSTAGGLRCHLGARIRIEAALPCDGADVLLDLGDRCIPLTTEVAQATLVDQDHVPGRQLPAGIDLIGGQAKSCDALRAGGASGMFLVSAANAFDVPLAGDVYLLLALGCE